MPALLYVESKQGYANLCNLLSHSGQLSAQHLDGQTDGLIAVSYNLLLAGFFPKRFYFALTSPESAGRVPSGFPAVPALAARYAVPQDREKFNIVQSIRTLTLLNQRHPEKISQGNLHFRPPQEIQNLFREFPDCIHHSNEIAGRCSFDFPFGPPQFPAFNPRTDHRPKFFYESSSWQDYTGATRSGLGNSSHKLRRSWASLGKSGMRNIFWWCGISCSNAGKQELSGLPGVAPLIPWSATAWASAEYAPIASNCIFAVSSTGNECR